MVIEHVVDGDQWNLRIARDGFYARQPGAVVPAIEHGSSKVDAMRRSLAQARQESCVTTHGDHFEPKGMREQIVETQNAFAFFGTEISERQQAGEPSPAGA